MCMHLLGRISVRFVRNNIELKSDELCDIYAHENVVKYVNMSDTQRYTKVDHDPIQPNPM